MSFLPLDGVLAVLRDDPDWPTHFDISRRGLIRSFGAAFATLVPYGVIAAAVQVERARLLDVDSLSVPWGPFLIVMGLFTLAFPFVAQLASTLLRVPETFARWTIARHWSVLLLAAFAALPFAMYMLGAIPYRAANLIGFLAYLALLPLDIRIARVAGGLRWGTATLVACVVTSMGLTFVLIGLLQVSS